MTHQTDILRRPPIMRPIPQHAEPAPQHDWTGERLIRAPKRKVAPEPVQADKPQHMHFTVRRKLVADLHGQGLTVPEIADKLDASTDKIYLDLRAMSLTAHPVDKKIPVVGDEDKARETFRALCKRHKITQAEFRNTKNTTPGMASLRSFVLVEIKAASGASIRLLSKVTGLQEQTSRMALRRAKRETSQ